MSITEFISEAPCERQAILTVMTKLIAECSAIDTAAVLENRKKK